MTTSPPLLGHTYLESSVAKKMKAKPKKKVTSEEMVKRLKEMTTKASASGTSVVNQGLMGAPQDNEE